MAFCEDFEDTESAAYLADTLEEERRKRHVLLVVPAPTPKVEIGSRWSGRREVYYDTKAGIYEEANPMMDVWARWLQAALLPGPRTRARKPEDVRQRH